MNITIIGDASLDSPMVDHLRNAFLNHTKVYLRVEELEMPMVVMDSDQYSAGRGIEVTFELRDA